MKRYKRSAIGLIEYNLVNGKIVRVGNPPIPTNFSEDDVYDSPDEAEMHYFIEKRDIILSSINSINDKLKQKEEELESLTKKNKDLIKKFPELLI